MANSILVLTSGWAGGSPALARAIQVADKGAAIGLFDVVYEPSLEGYMGNRDVYESLRRRVVAERQESADALARELAGQGFQVTARAVWGHPLHEVVAAEVVARKADLIVFSPQLREAGLAHRDWRLVLTSPAPTLVVQSSAAASYANIVAAVDPLHAHAKSAALDEAILRRAKALAECTGASLTVLHCFTPLEYFGADLGVLAGQGTEERRKAIAALTGPAGIDPGAVRVVAGAPEDVIRQMAANGEADLIVMGALARSRFKELLVGHTAERVLHGGSVDVLVVKPQT